MQASAHLSIKPGGLVRLHRPPLSTLCGLREGSDVFFPPGLGAGLGAWPALVSLVPEMGGKHLSCCVWERASPCADVSLEFQSKPPQSLPSARASRSESDRPHMRRGRRSWPLAPARPAHMSGRGRLGVSLGLQDPKSLKTALEPGVGKTGGA